MTTNTIKYFKIQKRQVNRKLNPDNYTFFVTVDRKIIKETGLVPGDEFHWIVQEITKGKRQFLLVEKENVETQPVAT